MPATAKPVHVPPDSLWATRAVDLMTSNPASISETATLRDAVRFLTDKGFSAAPVINDAGRPIGVLSRADILVHERERADCVRPNGTENATADPALVRDLMSPFVLVVDPDTPADAAARQLVAFRVHRLFVVDANGVLIGVISALDLLRHLQPQSGSSSGGPGRSAYHDD